MSQSATATEAALRWDLESIFAGGSASETLATFREAIRTDLENAEAAATSLPTAWDDTSRDAWVDFALRLQEIGSRINTIESFAGCLVSQDVADDAGHALVSEADVMASRWLGLRTTLESFAISQDDHTWNEFAGDARLSEVRFYLDELRERGREKMAPEQERLAQELAVDGYHGWNRLYDKMAGDLSVQFTTDGKTKTISLGQLAMFMSNSRRDIREEAFKKLEEAWETRASLAAMALNYQGGFRLSLYKNRKWSSFLQEPLAMGRLQERTLEAMWGAVADAVPRLVPYIDAKKNLLGIDRFRWYDQTAPVGAAERTFSFDEAGRFIVAQLAEFSGDMADFSEMALKNRWVEAENRAGKAGGGFCTDFPTHKATRIFMTWGGEYDHLMTLAHELGHSYHAWVLKDMPYWTTHYPMNLAETASTFNELRVTDAALKSTTDPREQLMLLDQKLVNAHTMFCNLRARFLFDTAFYTERRNGMVPRARLDELMTEAQRQAYGGTLADPDGFHPLFWASKLHFFITDHPFYNFPYVYGFLFANGVYDRAQSEGASFADRYRDLLADTGRMTSEEVAQKHLGVDLTRREFWDAAVDRILADVDPFVNLASESK
jgi:oligoendopeptidase F